MYTITSIFTRLKLKEFCKSHAYSFGVCYRDRESFKLSTFNMMHWEMAYEAMLQERIER